MSAITAKASRKMKKYAVLTREPRCFLGSFDFSWEQRKAIDIADYSKGNGYSKGDLADAGTPIILYGRLYTKYQFAISEVDTFAVPRNGAVYSQGNEVIVPASGETAEDIARASAVEKSGVLLGGDLNILRPFDFMNPLFLALAISNGEPQKELAKKAQGKSVVHIHNTDIQEVTIAYPSKTEQDRIVSVFRQLDNLITLHQRKCVLLFGFFQAFISMIFTSSTFSWEQRKLGEVSESYSGGTPSVGVKEYYGGQIPFIRSAEINSEITELFLTEEGLKNSSARLVAVGDILYALYGATSGEVGRARLKGAINQAILAIKPHTDYDSEYLAQWLRKSKHSIIETYLQGGQGNLSGTIVKELSVDFPSLKEQKAIGDFFRQLDNLITLHQRECISFTARAGRLILTANKKRNTSSWEQRKLEDYLTVSVEKNTGNIYGRSDVLSVSGDYGIVNQIEFQGRSFAGASVSNYGVVQTGDVVYTKSPLNSNPYGIIKTNKGKPGIVSTLYAVYHPKENAFSDFIQVYFEQHARMNNYMHPLVNKGAKNDMKVSAENALKGPVCFPSCIEQESISAFFSVLDNLITLHQRKPFLMKWRTSDANRNQTNRLVL